MAKILPIIYYNLLEINTIQGNFCRVEIIQSYGKNIINYLLQSTVIETEIDTIPCNFCRVEVMQSNRKRIFIAILLFIQCFTQIWLARVRHVCCDHHFSGIWNNTAAPK